MSLVGRLARFARRRLARRDPDVVVSWNAKVGRKRRELLRNLAALIDDTRADVVGLQEAQQYVTVIRLRFGLRWRVYARTGWAESDNCPVMVRRRIRLYGKRPHRWGVVRMERGWVGPKHHKPHPGRTWTWLRTHPMILNLHRATGGSGHRTNGPAYAEEGHRLTAFLRNRHCPVLALGDTNTQADDERPGSMLNVAELVRGELITDPLNAGIDYALGVRLLEDWRARRIGRYDSDHRALVLEKE